MSDLISRQAAIMAVLYGSLGATTIYGRTEQGMAAQKEIVQAIRMLPSAERKGHWMKKWHTVFKEELPCCSECNNFMAFRWDYCPNCGARMDGE